MFDRRLTGSVTRYDMRYQDIQLAVQGTNPTTGESVASTFNAGGAKIQGIEVELQALLFSSLRLSFTGDFSQAGYTRFDDRSVPGGSRVGEPLAFIPDYRVSGSIENRFALDGEMALTPRVQVTRTGERIMITDPSPIVRNVARVAPFNLVDASLRFDLNEKVSFDLYGKNIFNKKYKNDTLGLGFVVLAYYGAPVTYGATARIMLFLPPGAARAGGRAAAFSAEYRSNEPYRQHARACCCTFAAPSDEHLPDTPGRTVP
jgi:iron complex outermembrane receptor protein